MTRSVFVLLVLATGIEASREQKAEPERSYSGMAQSLRASLDVLALVRAESDIVSTKRKLLECEEQYRKSLGPKELVVDVSSSDFKEYDAFMAGAMKRVVTESQRLSDLALLTELEGCFPIQMVNERFKRLVTVKIETFDHRLESLKTVFGVVPVRLEYLTKPSNGAPALCLASDLLDPWGRPYQYDYRGMRNFGARPDVWSLGPIGGGDHGVIANWNFKREVANSSSKDKP